MASEDADFAIGMTGTVALTGGGVDKGGGLKHGGEETFEPNRRLIGGGNRFCRNDITSLLSATFPLISSILSSGVPVDDSIMVSSSNDGCDIIFASLW